MDPRRILIASGDPTSAVELGERLARLGYDVVATVEPSGVGGWLAGGVEPDLVVAEGAPLPEAPLRVPVIVLAAGPDERPGAAGEGAEPSARVPLPCSDRELRLHLELALSRHRRARAVDEMEAFFSVSIDMFCFLGFDGRFRRLNPAWERTLGFTREELMSRPFIEFVHPDDRERTLRQNADVRGGGQALGFENRYLCKDGTYRWLLWNSAPRPGERVVFAVARDVTARKQAEEERSRLVTQLETSLAEVRTLQDILPICSYCRKIRDDEDFWHSVEDYLARHTGTLFSHGICPDCMAIEVERHFGPEGGAE